MIKIKRYKNNPIIVPKIIKPSRDDFEVIGAFNPAVAQYGDQTILLMRVAERPKQVSKELKIPFFSLSSKSIEVIDLDKTKFNLSDPRVAAPKNSKYDFNYLTSISHIRCARSFDGINFTIDDEPFIFPHNEYETFGLEDPRCTKIGDVYYINFSAVSPKGVCVELVSTMDFKSYKDEGVIFLPDNKDVTIFSGMSSGSYWALSRPSVPSTGNLDVWISSSSDLHEWGRHKKLFGGSNSDWDNGRVGAGIPPFLTPYGWLEIYHAANNKNEYSLGAILLDRDDPTKIIARYPKPIMVPEYEYETNGFFGKVVFTCGGILNNNDLIIYYGAADTNISVAKVNLDDILSGLEKNSNVEG
ncbi:glycoside hydrolase family 130 protein [Oenococcus alcoholitolerans]|uniref:glycoside hydrolase family 130 protein n=1 Tax=Oenococcus alcoholitolerans TaxID=931074 RepID=UPI003F6F8905